MTTICLNDLYPTHILRNTKMSEMKVSYRAVGTKIWQELMPSFNISKNTFNELAPVWTKGQEWVVEDPESWDEGRIDSIGQNGNDGEHYV